LMTADGRCVTAAACALENGREAGGACVACDAQCDGCDADGCLACVHSDAFVYAGQCVTQCPPAMMHINDTCVSCDAECTDCSGTPERCTACADPLDFLWPDGRCAPACPKATTP